MAAIDEKMLKVCLEAIADEYRRARTRFPPMASMHEGLSIIREEYLELEEVVYKEKDITARTWNGSLEARQTAAMCLSFMMEVCTKEKAWLARK
jgi:hypothetical protein